MKLPAISLGRITRLEVQCARGQDFGEVLPPFAEVRLFKDPATGETCLILPLPDIEKPAKVFSINFKSGSEEVFYRVIEGSDARMCWIVKTEEFQGKTHSILLQIHEFSQRVVLESDLEIGIDENALECMQRGKKKEKLLTINDAVRTLEKELLLVGPNSKHRFFISGSIPATVSGNAGFTLWGDTLIVEVSPTTEEKYKITSIKPFRKPVNGDYKPINLGVGFISFKDYTIIGCHRGIVKCQIDQMVAQAGSYIKIWNEYNQIEEDSVKRRSRQFGYFTYNGYRFTLGNVEFQNLDYHSDLGDSLQSLPDMNDHVDLEACAELPRGLFNDEASLDRFKRERSLVGELVSFDQRQKVISLRPIANHVDITPSESGYLFLSIQGNIKILERRKKAQELIVSAMNPMPQLALLIEGEGNIFIRERSRHYEPISPSVRALVREELNPRQIEALDIALNTPDIALIQGPPGTGKTSVIVALQARLAEIALDPRKVSGQTLLTSYQHDAVENAAGRTMVFGLPAIKIGNRQGTKGNATNVTRWRESKAEKIKEELKGLPENQVNRVYKTVRDRVAAYRFAPTEPLEGLLILKEVQEKAFHFLDQALLSKISKAIESESGAGEASIIPSERIAILKIIRGLRTTPESFGDDGPRSCNRVLNNIREYLSPEAIDLLTGGLQWPENNTPSFLWQLEELKAKLLDKFMPDERPLGSTLGKVVLEKLLREVVEALFRKTRTASGGKEGILAEFLDDLELDPSGVERTVEKYTVVVAATCQQAASRYMTEFLESEGGTFKNVIVDEAARANPLDLLIPLSMAEQRIILVGDHRQLPHILEPDVEKELEKSIVSETHEALRKSLFERLFQKMRKREALDGIRRTITLNVQFRMHPILGEFISKAFYEPYGEEFGSGRPAVEFRHELPGYEEMVACWKDIPFSAGEERGGQSKTRPSEVEWIAQELKRLVDCAPDLSFGVITMYKAQETRIFQALEKYSLAEKDEDSQWLVAAKYRLGKTERLRVGTVDAFQGKEFDVVFLSLVRSNRMNCTDNVSLRRKFGFLLLESRLCVAMSRQKRLLITVGDKSMFQSETAKKAVPSLNHFIELCETKHGRILS